MKTKCKSMHFKGDFCENALGTPFPSGFLGSYMSGLYV